MPALGVLRPLRVKATIAISRSNSVWDTVRSVAGIALSGGLESPEGGGDDLWECVLSTVSIF